MRKICLRCGSKFGSQAEYCPHDGTRLSTDDEVPDSLLGTVLLEQFRIDEVIGTGGMGTVYRARQTTIGRDVAIKVLRLELARDEGAVLRFEREAELAASLDHPNLVRVFLSGRLSDGRIYMVMELLEGRSLADELDQLGAPSLERAVVMVIKLCAGLAAVHAKGIVHRDIKPENVYLVERGSDEDFVKLVDFGISRALDADTLTTRSQSGRVFGTAAYISPEAAMGEPADCRSDIYSTGVLTYQLLTGELPFEGKTAGALLMQHVHEDPPPIYTKGIGDQVPRGIAEVVMRALEKEPSVRFQNLGEFVDALTRGAVDAGLLTDARALLLGTVWGGELAAPGSFLAELLGASSAPGGPNTLALQLDRSPEDEAFFSSAPEPFETASQEFAPTPTAPALRRRSHVWLWASLGALAVVFAVFVARAWWWQRSPAPPDGEPAESPQEPERSVPPPKAVAPEVPPPPTREPEVTPPPMQADAGLGEKPKKNAKRKTNRRKKRVKSPPVQGGGAAVTEEPVAEEFPAGATDDDGIDWTVPGFPENEPTDSGAVTATPEAPEPPATPESAATPESPAAPEAPEPPDARRAPTGTPDAPTRNPLVIDEVPAPDESGSQSPSRR